MSEYQTRLNKALEVLPHANLRKLKPSAKTPAGDGWQTTPYAVEDIQRDVALGTNSRPNIGVRIGDDLVHIDLDVRARTANGGDANGHPDAVQHLESYFKSKGVELDLENPGTTCWYSGMPGGSRHLLFKIPAGTRLRRHPDGFAKHGFTFKQGGVYAVAPPSRVRYTKAGDIAEINAWAAETGESNSAYRRYEWHPMGCVPPAELPQAIIDDLLRPENTASVVPGSTNPEYEEVFADDYDKRKAFFEDLAKSLDPVAVRVGLEAKGKKQVRHPIRTIFMESGLNAEDAFRCYWDLFASRDKDWRPDANGRDYELGLFVNKDTGQIRHRPSAKGRYQSRGLFNVNSVQGALLREVETRHGLAKPSLVNAQIDYFATKALPLLDSEGLQIFYDRDIRDLVVPTGLVSDDPLKPIDSYRQLTDDDLMSIVRVFKQVQVGGKPLLTIGASGKSPKTANMLEQNLRDACVANGRIIHPRADYLNYCYEKHVGGDKSRGDKLVEKYGVWPSIIFKFTRDSDLQFAPWMGCSPLVVAVAGVLGARHGDPSDPRDSQRCVPTFWGSQEDGKSHAIVALLPNTWSISTSYSVSNADIVSSLLGKMVMELAELGGLSSPRSKERIKSLQSAASVRTRLSYDRRSADFAIRVAQYGTGNPDEASLQSGDEHSRILSVEVVKNPSLGCEPYEWVLANREKLWAMAVHLYKSGYSVELPHELRQARYEANIQFRHHSAELARCAAKE